MRPRLLGGATGALLTMLVAVQPALARGGSGSGGFGRGFGGGGLGRGFGRGHFFFIPIGGGGGLLLLIIVAIVVLYVLPRLMIWWRGQQTAGAAARRRVAERERRVELAAAEAADEDPAFSPDVVRSAAAKLFLDVQSAWDSADRTRLRDLVAADLLTEWELRLDDLKRRGWHNRVQPLGEPRIEYVGLRHGGEERSDRVVVRIEATLRDYVEDAYGQRIDRVDALSDVSRIREYWTLGKSAHPTGGRLQGPAGEQGGPWMLLSIEQGAEGEHELEEDLVASPWADERTMRDDALVEGAVAEAVPPGTQIAEVADLDFQGDARAAALDLSLADGRFAPDVLEVAARRAVAAWAEAVDGEDSMLLAIADPQAAQQLLHPGDPARRTRLVVRGPRVRQIRIVALDAAANPPTMTIDVQISGRRYIEDRETAAVIAGSQARETSFNEHWTLALDGDEAQPWRIAGVRAPIGRV